MPAHPAAVALFALCITLPLAAQQPEVVERTYAIRSGGRVIGHQIEREEAAREGDREVVRFAVHSLVKKP